MNLTDIFERQRNNTGLLATMLVILIYLTSTHEARSQNKNIPVSVISNNVGSPDNISLRELRSVFLGEKQRWPKQKNQDKEPKVFVALLDLNRTDKQLVNNICKKVFDMSADDLQEYWLQLVFKGHASKPTYFNSVNDLRDFIAKTPGAIGIVDQPTSTDNIKTVLIDGKKSL